MEVQGKEEGVPKGTWASIKVLKTEKVYWFWWLTLFISYLGIIYSLFNGNIDSSFSTGAFYSTGITIIAPFFTEILISNIVKKKKEEETRFVVYRSKILLLSLAYIFSAFLFISTKLVSCVVLQLVFTVVTCVYSFYVCLISKMEDHPEALKQYTDSTYAQEQNSAIMALNTDANQMRCYQTDDGEEIEL